MKKGKVIALGYFDGVHLGHGGLLRKARQMADELGALAAAVTFHPHPSVLLTGKSVPLLTSDEDRARLMQTLYGMDEVLTLPFDKALMTMPWLDFLETVLIRGFDAAGLVCGHDFRFGYRGEGTAEKLQAFCEARGIPCAVIPEIRLEGKTVSSTLLRQLLKEGDMDAAVRFLGHPHVLTGTVEHGFGRGNTWGIPTANVPFPRGIAVPARGVYATRVLVDGIAHIAVTNVGTHPTVGNTDEAQAEAWLLDFSGDLYGKTVTVEFYRLLREERRFPSVEALVAEIRRNAEETRAYFKNPAVTL